MERINTITVQHQGNERPVLLYLDYPDAENVDVLIVSAFLNDNTPTSSSMIGALARAGISVADLAQKKEVNLSNFSSCWLSTHLRVHRSVTKCVRSLSGLLILQLTRKKHMHITEHFQEKTNVPIQRRQS